MQLSAALRLKSGHAVAFTGAGGKSAALRRLAGELPPDIPALLTTTTRLGLDQADLATRHLVIAGPGDLEPLPELLERDGSVLLTGPALPAQGKWTGIPPGELLDAIHRAASRAGGALLIEADGGRGRSLKAPAEHEPVVPEFADLVVPVAGLDALGQPLDAATVHRPERAASLLSVPRGTVLQATHLAELLTSEQAGLRGVPAAAEVRVLLNKAEGEAARLAGAQLAESLLTESRIHGVILGSVQGDPPVQACFGRVAGIVLAAGGSTRFGSPKQLIPFRGRPLVWHAVRAAIEGGLAPVLVVTGAAGQEVSAALAEEPVRLISNPAWQEGQATSVRAGLAAAADGVEAVIFLLADMPLVGGELVRAIVAAHRSTRSPLVAPRVGDRRANPVLFDRDVFPALQELSGDQGGRSLFERFPAVWLDWSETAMLDLDTPGDLDRLRRFE